MRVEMFFGANSYVMQRYDDSHDALECFAYPGALRDRWVAGTHVRFESASRGSWVGHFLGGDESPNAADICCDHPDGIHAVIVAGGVAYQISPTDPESWTELPIRPVMGVCASISAKALFLFDYSRAMVLTADGGHWVTGALSWDGLKNIREADGVIYGQGWDASTGGDVPFEIDLASRVVKGGASPPNR